jgi:acyl phosphate:glycerol-3-phosphate acyltransferase
MRYPWPRCGTRQRPSKVGATLTMQWIEQLESAPLGQAGAIALGAYALGCCTTGYYLVRWRLGEDIRSLGSGSVGARNVGRVLGWAGFTLTVLGDFGKGALAVWATQRFAGSLALDAVALLAVVAGHIWPVQLWFRGGKGVATSLGALAAYDLHLALAFAALFVCTSAIARKTVLPGLFAFACLPWVSAYLGQDAASIAQDYGKVLSTTILAGFVWIAHRRNLIDELSALAQRRFHPEEHSSKL